MFNHLIELQLAYLNFYHLILQCTDLRLMVSVKENEVPTEKNSSRASIFATKASYISN